MLIMNPLLGTHPKFWIVTAKILLISEGYPDMSFGYQNRYISTSGVNK